MPPPTPPSASNTPFSLHHPRKLITTRPNAWFALETLVEFVVVSYLIWALFYFIYLWLCGAVWMVKGLRDTIARRRGGTKPREERPWANREEKLAEPSGQQPGPAYKDMDEKIVEDGLFKKRWKDGVTNGNDTGHERRMTV